MMNQMQEQRMTQMEINHQTTQNQSIQQGGVKHQINNGMITKNQPAMMPNQPVMMQNQPIMKQGMMMMPIGK